MRSGEIGCERTLIAHSKLFIRRAKQILSLLTVIARLLPAEAQVWRTFGSSCHKSCTLGKGIKGTWPAL